MSLDDLARPMLNSLNREMQHILRAEQHPPPDHLHGMMQYHMGWLNKSFEPARTKAGKQIRPLLLMLTCAAAGGDWQTAVPAAAAIELVHNFSLIHDDIEDKSPTRRGRATLWQVWGVPLAINAGDAMFATAHLALTRLAEKEVPAPIVVESLRRFDETCLQLTQGQHLDMAFETRNHVTVAEYLHMITGKTSVLLSLSAELGAAVAEVDSDRRDHFAQFGLNLGLAFQILDDILGIWGDEALIGKSASSDIETRKKTLPILYGMEQNEELRMLYLKKQEAPDFVERVVELLDLCGAREFARAEAKKHTKSALEHLDAADPDGEAGRALHTLTDQLLSRQS